MLNKTVLLVDDNPDHLSLMSHSIKDSNPLITVKSVESGEKALEEMKRYSCDIAIIDYRMPKMNGIEVLEEMQKKGLNIPVIIITGVGDEQIAAKAIKKGAYDYITKTGDYFSTLPLVIQNTLEHHQLRMEQKSLIRTLNDSEKRYRDLVEGSPDCILSINACYYIIAVNQKTVEILGYPRVELLGMSILKIFPNDQKEKIHYFLKTVQELEHLAGFQSKALTKKGKLIDIEISSTAQYNDNRELMAIHSIYRDITERKRSDEALKKSEKRYRDLVELAQDGIWQIDEKGITTFVNKRMAEMLDYSVQEMMGESFYHFVCEKEKQTYQAQISQSLNEVKVRFDVEFIKRDGSSIFTMVSTSSIFDEENTRQEILMVVTDITYRIISERKLREAFEKVKRADSLKTIFLANMSHEIRTPLNNILGFVDLALLDNLPEQTMEKMANIKNSGKQLLSIINDILDLAKIEAGQIQIEMLPTTMESIFYNFRSIAEVIVYHYVNKPLEIREHFPSHLNREIITDDIKLNQIFNRLLNNAAKFTSKGYIEYGVKLNTSNQLQFYVKDSGVGIPKEKQQVIFNAFEQVDSSITKPYSGTGLGLTICKKIVELMGGEIWVESEPNKGSTFYFTIPYLPTAIKQCQMMENSIMISPIQENKTILIVEDIDLNQKLMKALLEKTGYSVLLAQNGNESISIYKANTLIDLIIMDLMLPQMNGFEAMQIIRQIEKEENRKPVPIIALSAYSFLEEIQSGVTSGFDNYLMKPVDTDVLYKIIKSYLHC